jgi:hypothetical protein
MNRERLSIASDDAVPDQGITETNLVTHSGIIRGLTHPACPVAADKFLAPLTINERADAKRGPAVNKNGSRANDKSLFPLSVPAYLSLLDWTARQIARGNRG